MILGFYNIFSVPTFLFFTFVSFLLLTFLILSHVSLTFSGVVDALGGQKSILMMVSLFLFLSEVENELLRDLN